jgi:hypothetical protein
MKRVGLLAVIPGLLLPALAFAQGGDSGSIIGYVMDQTGNPVQGVKVTATSATQIGGPKVAYSGDDGGFRMRALIPGVFEVRATAPKLNPVVQKDVQVGITAPAELTFVMEVQTKEDVVIVVQRAPLVSTTRANVAEEFGSDFIEALPHGTSSSLAGRDNIHRDMLGSVAGSVANRMRGGAANQTIVTQDGFDMGPPGKTISPSLKASAAFEIQTAGYGADNPTASGGVLNLVTRSGSNKFEFELNASADSNTLQFFKDQRDTSLNSFYYVINPTIAGPIIQDKLWFFVNTETHFTQDGRERDIEGIFADPLPAQRIIQKGSTKLTWQISSRNKVSLINNYEFPFERNRVGGVGVEPEAQQDRHTQRIFLGAIWESVLRDDLILRSQVGGTYLPEHIYPALCRDEANNCDDVPAVIQTFPRRQLLSNADNHTRTDVYALQFINQLEWLADSKLLGEHNVSLKDRFYTEQEVRKSYKPGDRTYELNGNIPLALTTFYSNDPRYEDPRYGWAIGTDTLTKNTLTLADTWRPTRHLTLTPSLSSILAKADNSAGDQVINTNTWAPGLAVVWDATHDGRTALRGSASSYVDLDVGAVARHTIPGQVQQRCLWNPANEQYDLNCVYSGGANRNTIGLPCGPLGFDEQGRSCHTSLKVPRTFEITAGGEREVVPGMALSLDFVHRTFNNQYEVNETNRVWNVAGNGLDRLGGYKNGRAETISDLGTPDGANRRYDGVTFGLTKREGRFKANVSYTWSKLRGTVAGGTGNAWGDIPGRDVFLVDTYLPDDNRHAIKAAVAYQATRWLSFGSRTTYQSGFPYDHLYRNPETSGFDVYRASRGIDPGNNINDPNDDRALRLPDRMEMNLQARVNLMPLIGRQLDLYADFLNLLALRTATAVGTSDGQDFGVQRSWLAPMRVRLGLNFRY